MAASLSLKKANSAFELLAQRYGLPQRTDPTERRNPLDALIEVVIAQNTSRTNRNRALRSLYQRFPDPTLIAEANVADVIDAIYVAGLANVKAPRLQGMVSAAAEATGGSGDLSFLHDLPTDGAFQFLTSLPGIGAMSASLVLLFTMGRPVLPVNTGLYRVAMRVGLIPPRTGAERAQWLLQSAIPCDRYYAFHVNTVRHARETCQAARPACERCCLTPVCNFVHSAAIPAR